MDNSENTAPQAEAAKEEGPLVGAAKTIGSVVGKVASLVGAGEKEKKTPPKKPPVKLKENAYKAEYLGSGTFNITKPKRAKAKRRQSALKNRRRGSRK